jgi:hypothetical protein
VTSGGRLQVQDVVHVDHGDRLNPNEQTNRTGDGDRGRAQAYGVADEQRCKTPEVECTRRGPDTSRLGCEWLSGPPKHSSLRVTLVGRASLYPAGVGEHWIPVSYTAPAVRASY